MVLQKHKISQNILQDIRAGPTPTHTAERENFVKLDATDPK
jgi:hypothetical protein